MDSGFAPLVDFIGAMRVARSGGMVRATVTAAGAGMRVRYGVTARTPEGSFELVTDGFTMTYFPAQALLLAAEGSERPEPEERALFPMNPPVLAMFSPLDLPIWGGPHDNHRVVSAEPSGQDQMRLEFVSTAAPTDPDRSGHALIDLNLGITLELRYHGRTYLTTDIRATERLPR